ncbi:YHYH protein [Colwelliaceae bacterium 6471]
MITPKKHYRTVKFKHFMLMLTLALGSGCGSSSNDSADDVETTPTNSIPIANAGNEQTVTVGSTVELSAAQSSDADNDELTYAWQLSLQPSGSNATLASTTNISTSFIADVAGNYSVTLTVNDGKTSSDTDTVVVTASENSNNAINITNAILTNKDGSCGQYVGSYYSNVEDLQRGLEFNGDITISTANEQCIFAVNEIPNHDFNDSSAAFASNVSEQSGQYQLPIFPVMATSVTELSLGTTNAILLNGVVIDLLAAACYDVGNEPIGQEKIGCGEDEIDNPWRYDPMSPLNNFGTDIHNAHVQPDGTYHYHGNPMSLFEVDCDITAEESAVIGFAADGYPIYGSCFNKNGSIEKAQSSYQLKNGGAARMAVNGYTTPEAGVGVVASNNYDGQFRGDYEYVENSGDLDECNGMTVNGQYGYYVTDSYPWVMACYKGTPDASMKKQGAAMQNRMHAHESLSHHH